MKIHYSCSFNCIINGTNCNMNDIEDLNVNGDSFSVDSTFFPLVVFM